MMFNLDDYEPVADRLHRFRTDYTNARTATELQHHWVSDDGTRESFIVFARIWRDMDDAHPFATGLAQEHTALSGVNKTAALENCETSALGRALANGGYAPKEARPSREEMEKVSRAGAATLDSAPGPGKGVAPVEPPTVPAGAAPATTAEAVANVLAAMPGAQVEAGRPDAESGSAERGELARLAVNVGLIRYAAQGQPALDDRGRQQVDWNELTRFAAVTLGKPLQTLKGLRMSEVGAVRHALLVEDAKHAEIGVQAAKGEMPVDNPWA